MDCVRFNNYLEADLSLFSGKWVAIGDKKEDILADVCLKTLIDLANTRFGKSNYLLANVPSRMIQI